MNTAASSMLSISGSFLCNRRRPHEGLVGHIAHVHQYHKCQFQFLKVSPTRRTFARTYRHIRYASVGNNGHRGLSYDNGPADESFMLSMVKDIVWSLKSLLIFLAEQPSQLKYIEWPTFQDTLKTATLTLVLVALLIVALSTVDSALCYILALWLRKSA